MEITKVGSNSMFCLKNSLNIYRFMLNIKHLRILLNLDGSKWKLVLALISLFLSKFQIEAFLCRNQISQVKNRPENSISEDWP